VGVVVKAKNTTGQVCALKILRTDANRPSMEAEFKLTSMANRIGVGVRVLDYTRDLLVMDLLEHIELHQWLSEQKGRGKAARTRDMVHMILNQCRKHVVVARDKPWIIDFESAGKGRKPKNVTTAAQYLFVGSRMSPLVRRTLGISDTSRLLGLLRTYKQTLSDISYAKILESLKIPAG
jgi:putative serine/threonine protein kinase